jgi:NDP-sugar pyrophosphorylase family protein
MPGAEYNHMQAVILAAGKGYRLHPITTSTSKAMLPILGKPIIERVMETLAVSGMGDFILVISPDDYQNERLGMAHALHQAARLLRDDFVLSACDNLFSRKDFQRLLYAWKTREGLQALLALIRVPEAEIETTGIVTLEGDRVTGIVEKPASDRAITNIASMPLYCFSQRILDFLPRVQRSPRGEYELQDAIQMLIEEGDEVRGLFFESRLTLTTATDLLNINRHFLENSEEDWQNDPEAVGPGTQLLDPLYIGVGTVIGSACMIGPNVYIDKNVRIGNEVQLRNVIVLQDGIIPDKVVLKDQVVR